MSDSSDDPLDDDPFSEYLPSHPQQLAEPDAILAQQSKKKRGRKKHVLLWTRVVSINDDDLAVIQIFQLPTDLDLNRQIRKPSGGDIDEDWEPLFFPRRYSKLNPDLQLSDRRLDSE